MSIRMTHLRKALKLLEAPKNIKISTLRDDIRQDNRKSGSSGGDFHGPFWSDAKKHASGEVDLKTEGAHRVSKNDVRKRLYPILIEGFLKWWNEKRRWRNEPFNIVKGDIKGRHSITQLKTTIKVENILAFQISDDTFRIIYPYFSEKPILSSEGARIGLWLMHQALSSYKIEDMRILDILRSQSFSVQYFPLLGNEEDIFLRRYKEILDEWEELKKQY
ncbi:hypothetical protein [Inquilinus sp. CA228]|uniref:hypothetical protein n=1 Tax=Inquilinus sp. CA228 TaxID=3455609 RepID=UPI003F8D0776